MGFIKKILYAVLITSLLIGGTVVAAVLTGQFGSSGTGKDGLELIMGADDEPRIYRNALVRPRGSEVWHYYPEIANDAQPGSLTTVTVSAHGFLGWETDPNFSDVEIIDEKNDGDFIHLSFIIPLDDFALRGLFDSVLFYNDKVDLGLAPLSAPLETPPGEAPDGETPPGETPPGETPPGEFAGFSGLSIPIAPMSGTIITTPPTMPIGMVGVEYEAELQDYSGITWLPVVDQDLGEAGILGWSFNPTTRKISHSSPLVDDPVNFTLVYYTGATIPDPENPEGEIPVTAELPISITILPAMEIIPDALLDGMVGISYNMQLDVNDLPAGVGAGLWKWGIDIYTGTGLTGSGLNLGTGTGLISGEPTTATTYTFKVTLSSEDPRYIAYAEKEFSIKIWNRHNILERPELDPLPDGMVGERYHWNTDISILPAPALTDATVDATGDSYWLWIVDLPDGLIFTYDAVGVGKIQTATATTLPASSAGDHIITITLAPRIPNPNVETISQAYPMKIWERPVFLTDINDLPDGMDSLRRYGDDEPEDDEYKAMIQVWFPENMPSEWNWNWSLSLGDSLPPGLEAGGELLALEGFNDRRLISGYPRSPASIPLASTLHKFSVEIEVASDNKNIDTAVVSQPYNLMIWARRYLYVKIEQTTGYVIQQGEDARTDDKKVMWRENTTWESTPQAKLYEWRRAVMPGNDGIIRSLLGVSGFIRWEVRGPSDVADGTDLLNPSIYPNINSRVQIDNPNDYDKPVNYWTEGIHGYVKITMPGRVLVDGVPTFVAGQDNDVYIRGVHSRVPVVTPNWSPGTVGDPFGGVITIGGTDVGESGTRALRWDVISGDDIHRPTNSPAPGLTLNATGGVMTGIIGVPTQQNEAGYNFTVGIFLPGSMRVDRNFSIQVHPTPGVRLGDINGDGRIDLEDLVLLARYVAGERDFARFDEKAADLNGNGSIDGGDLRILAAFFAVPTAILPVAPPVT